MVSEKALARTARWRRAQKARDKDGTGKPPAAGGTPDAGTPLERLDRADGELLALHRARFTEWEPTAVVSLAAAGDGTALAVAREGGSIEIWETDYWTCVSVSLNPYYSPASVTYPCITIVTLLNFNEPSLSCRHWQAPGTWPSPALSGYKRRAHMPGGSSVGAWMAP